MKEGRKPECPEKTPKTSVKKKKMPPTKARVFKPQPKLEPVGYSNLVTGPCHGSRYDNHYTTRRLSNINLPRVTPAPTTTTATPTTAAIVCLLVA